MTGVVEEKDREKGERKVEAAESVPLQLHGAPSQLIIDAQPDITAIKQLLVAIGCQRVELVGEGSVMTALIGKDWPFAFYSASVSYQPHPSIAGAVVAKLFIDADPHCGPRFYDDEDYEEDRFHLTLDLNNLRLLNIHRKTYADEECDY